MTKQVWTESVILTLIMACAFDAAAATRVRTKLYFCRRAEKPPVLDGVLDDACWEKAYVMEDFGPMNIGDQKGPFPKTYARVVYDQDNMYFGFDCKEPLMDKFRKSLKGSNVLYWKDCLELYIDTRNDDKGYCALWANAVGESFSERRIDMDWAIVTDLSFRLWARWKYVPKMNDDGWVVEARVSMKDLNIPPQDGYVVGFNPCRFRLIVSPGQFLCWSTIGGRQKNPKIYGHMVLGDPPKKMEHVIKVLYPAYKQMVIEIPKGDSMDVYERGKVSRLSYKDAVAVRVKETEVFLAKIEKGLQATGSEGKLKKCAKELQAAKEEFAKTKSEYEKAKQISEGTCLRLLNGLGSVEKQLDAISWDMKTAMLIENFCVWIKEEKP